MVSLAASCHISDDFSSYKPVAAIQACAALLLARSQVVKTAVF